MGATRVLYVRDTMDEEVVLPVQEAARALRQRRRGQRVSDADVARQLILAALGTPAIMRRLGMNGRGAKEPPQSAA
jgi:hypothetical protein